MKVPISRLVKRVVKSRLFLCVPFIVRIPVEAFYLTVFLVRNEVDAFKVLCWQISLFVYFIFVI